jgi:hypothetical protein
MEKVPAELRKAFHSLLDEEEKREHLDTVLKPLANDGVDLEQVLIVIERAQREQLAANHASEEMVKRRDLYEMQRQGQIHLAKGIPRLMESLLPDDPNYDLVKLLSDKVIAGSTISDISGELSPPRGQIRYSQTGNRKRPWLREARDGLRHAGVSEREDREDLLSIFDLKRKQRRKE